jgi:hypothetical protein
MLSGLNQKHTIEDNVNSIIIAPLMHWNEYISISFSNLQDMFLILALSAHLASPSKRSKRVHLWIVVLHSMFTTRSIGIMPRDHGHSNRGLVTLDILVIMEERPMSLLASKSQAWIPSQ